MCQSLYSDEGIYVVHTSMHVISIMIASVFFDWQEKVVATPCYFTVGLCHGFFQGFFRCHIFVHEVSALCVQN